MNEETTGEQIHNIQGIYSMISEMRREFANQKRIEHQDLCLKVLGHVKLDYTTKKCIFHRIAEKDIHLMKDDFINFRKLVKDNNKENYDIAVQKLIEHYTIIQVHAKELLNSYTELNNMISEKEKDYYIEN